jgi:hypothetical protein
MSTSSTSDRPGDTLAALSQSSQGLLFPSETDAPLVPFLWPDPQAPVSAASVRRLAELPADTPIEQRDLVAFFAPATTEEDWQDEAEQATARRFQALVRTLQELLQEATVFRAGVEPQVDAFVVGRCAHGLAGLRTRLVET